MADPVPDASEKRVFYAIGDVHGENERLQALHDQIAAHHALFHGDRPGVLIHLGDYVDRGPDSCGVIETIMAAQARADMEVHALMGNHERMLLDAQLDVGALDNWLMNGGGAAIESYRKRGHDLVARAHLDWLGGLPTMLRFEAEGLVFVHAGVSPTEFPDENEAVRLWTRSPKFFDTQRWTAPALKGQRVIHGHTPTNDFKPFVSADGKRINIDTGAVFGGALTALVLAPDAEPEFLSA